MKKQIVLPIIGILLIGIIFLISEISNFTNLTNIGKPEIIVVDSTEYDMDSCAYYLNMAVEFTVDTLAGMEEYKTEKEKELSNCVEENIQLVKQLENNKNLPNWKSKYRDMEDRFKRVEKENINLISENYELKNSKPIVNYNLFEPSYSVGNEVLYFSDSIVYDDKNKTIVDLKIPYLVNYYKNGEHINPPDGIYTEIIYANPEINIHQEVSVINIITEDENGLVSNAVTQNPSVTIHNEGTIFDLSKKRIRQLVRKIDPEAKVLDVK